MSSPNWIGRDYGWRDRMERRKERLGYRRPWFWERWLVALLNWVDEV